MKKIIFVLPSLAAGGAERVISYVAQNLNPDKYEVTLIIVGFKKDSVYKTDNVQTIFLNKRRLIKAMPSIAWQIIRAKPDIVVSTMGHVNIFMGLLSFFFRKIHFIGREASVISSMKLYSHTQSPFYLFLLKLFYKRLSAIICQSQDMFIDLNANFNVDAQKLVIINNPITDYIFYKRSNSNENEVIQFVTVGRMSHEKGYERILKGLAAINLYDFHYTMIGDGPLKNDILDLVASLGLELRVTHIPYTPHVPEKLSQMDVFLQGSYVEGFPNAVLESCSVGTPAIAFDAPGGTREIIENGVSGFIVKDEKEFEKLLSNKSLVTSLNSAAISKYTLDKFDSSKILSLYELLFSHF